MSYRIFVASSAVVFLSACGSSSSGGVTGPSSSEVATSVVSGALNNTSGSAVAWNAPKKPKATFASRVIDALNPIGTAYAATWTCTSGSLSPAFTGPGADPYAYTPKSCSVTWDNGKDASSTWSGPFTLSYGSNCNDTNAWIELQAGGCALTRTTGTSGTTRTITGPDGNSYAITHNTNGAGTGWDSSVTPAPTDGGVVSTCDATGCIAGRTIVISGSNLVGTVTVAGDADKIWDHTVSTGATPITVTGSGATRVVSGSVTVQHNLALYTASATFNNVGYSEPGCCFPTSGSVTTTFSKGPDSGKTETLSFSAICGDATLTTASGTTSQIELEHCL
jgi:hypothetical protein